MFIVSNTDHKDCNLCSEVSLTGACRPFSRRYSEISWDRPLGCILPCICPLSIFHCILPCICSEELYLYLYILPCICTFTFLSHTLRPSRFSGRHRGPFIVATYSVYLFITSLAFLKLVILGQTVAVGYREFEHSFELLSCLQRLHGIEIS